MSGNVCIVIVGVCVGVCMFVNVRVCLYGGCVVFVCVSGHVFVAVVCLRVCMHVCKCACVLVWKLFVFVCMRCWP